MLGEDNELAPASVSVEHLGVVLKQTRQFIPFSVRSGFSHIESEPLQVLEQCNFSAEISDGPGGGGLIDDLLLDRLNFGVGSVVQVINIVFRKVGQVRGCIDADLGSALQELLFAEPLFQALAAVANRLVNRFRGRCQTPLENSQRESNGAFRPSFSRASARLNSVRT